MFFHVLNGHGQIQYQGAVAVPAIGLNGQPIHRLMPSNPRWNWYERTLFQVQEDFPGPIRTLAESMAIYTQGQYLTRNGDIGHYILIGDALREVCASANTVPGLRIPSDPTHLGPRLGFLKMEIETTATFYRCSTLSRVIGGKVATLGILPDETRLRN
jgi:hypothetical protein